MPDNFWLEFRLLNDGLEADAVMKMPLTVWNKQHNPVFRLFSSLPAELRLKVWDYLIAPRIVGIACLYDETQRDEAWESHSAIRPSVPVLLHVNQETRALALERYELSFEWKLPQQPDVAAGSSVPDLVRSTVALPAFFFTAQSDDGRAPAANRPSSSPPRTWFNFALDAVYLVGDLEPYDMAGLNRPMPYFLDARTTRRVRRTAISFGALRHRGLGRRQIFSALHDVAERFAPADGQIMVCVTERDEYTHAMLGHKKRLVHECYRPRTNTDAPTGPDEGNIFQKIWRDRHRRYPHRCSMKNVRFTLIPESDLALHVYDFMVENPVKRGWKEESSTAESNKP
ncbi:hypothetical protein F5Y10DRAFT_38442 [Nemania abortiva]|nr:hypothetical protein F5Y10DRAFT_38442 [Nemania abortiva]